VEHLAAALKRVHAVAVCTRVDEPEMEPAKQEVADEFNFSMQTSQDSDTALVPTSRPRLPANAEGPSSAMTVRTSEVHAHAGYMGAQVSVSDFMGSSPSTDRKNMKNHAAVGMRLSRRPEDEASKKLKADQIRKELEKCQSPAQRRLNRIGGLRGLRFGAPRHGLRGVVEHPAFDTICAVMIVLNSILVGYDVEWKTTHDEMDPWVEYSSYACSLFFFLELLVRLKAYKRHFFWGGDNCFWNLFDTLLVLFSIAEFITDRLSGSGGGGAASLGSGMKAVKMLRIARVFRVFRFFKELSLLALMIIDSMKSLMWALLMLSIILYVFAILFTQSASDHIKQRGPGVLEIQRQFGNIPLTVYSLLQAMLGGVSWGVASDALFDIHWTVAGLFFFYIFFTMLAFLNITTGVFVDNAVETARTQRDFLVQKETELKEKYLAEMRDLFMEMDEDGSGTVSMEEVAAYFEDPRVRSYFAALGLDSADTERLFNLLDCDEDGDVGVDEFLDGCLRLKGLARSIDVQHLLMEFKKFNKMLNQIVAGHGDGGNMVASRSSRRVSWKQSR